MSRVLAGMIPPRGFHYVDPSGYRVPHTGEATSLENLMDLLITYRLENNLPVNDVRLDIENYICNNFPNMCAIQVANSPFYGAALPAPQGQRRVDLVAAWANSLYEHAAKLNLVTENEAMERAARCKGCPCNEAWENECPPCVTNAQRLLTIARQSRDVSDPGKMHYCSYYKFDTRTAVWLDLAHFVPRQNPPEVCWLKA